MKTEYVLIQDDNTSDPKRYAFAEKNVALETMDCLQRQGKHISLYVYTTEEVTK